jgi:Flp pilus assembly protein TadD
MRHSSILSALLAAGVSITGLWAGAASARTDTTQAAAPPRGLYLQLIRQTRADGRPRAAIAYLDDFDRQFPRDRDAALLRINSLLDLGQVDQAEAVLSAVPRSGKEGGKDGAALDVMRGHILAARGQWDAAVPAYTTAVAADPTSPVLRNALGYALLRAHQPGAAIEALRGAADLAPDDAVIRNNLILAYTVGGQKLAAADAISRIEDRHAQAILRRQVMMEAARITAPVAPLTLTAAAAPVAPLTKER